MRPGRYSGFGLEADSGCKILPKRPTTSPVGAPARWPLHSLPGTWRLAQTLHDKA